MNYQATTKWRKLCMSERRGIHANSYNQTCWRVTSQRAVSQTRGDKGQVKSHESILRLMSQESRVKYLRFKSHMSTYFLQSLESHESRVNSSLESLVNITKLHPVLMSYPYLCLPKAHRIEPKTKAKISAGTHKHSEIQCDLEQLSYPHLKSVET